MKTIPLDAKPRSQKEAAEEIEEIFGSVLKQTRSKPRSLPSQHSPISPTPKKFKAENEVSVPVQKSVKTKWLLQRTAPQIESWDGKAVRQLSTRFSFFVVLLERSCFSDHSKRRPKLDLYNEEYDRGRQKKARKKNQFRDPNAPNPFQEVYEQSKEKFD